MLTVHWPMQLAHWPCAVMCCITANLRLMVHRFSVVAGWVLLSGQLSLSSRPALHTVSQPVACSRAPLQAYRHRRVCVYVCASTLSHSESVLRRTGGRGSLRMAMCSPCCPPGNVCVWQELPFVKGCGDGIEAVRVDLATGEFKHAKKNPFKHHVQCNTVIHPPPTRSARHLRTWLAGTYARARTHAHTTAV